MKYLKTFLLFAFIGLTACVQAGTKNYPVTLSSNFEKIYDSGQSLVLYSYEDDSLSSEAYADWDAYLNDFKKGHGKSYFYSKVTNNEFESIPSGTSEFTLFLKKGHPTLLYDGFIVEPQVYTAVHRKFSKETLTNVDNAFMPNEISNIK